MTTSDDVVIDEATAKRLLAGRQIVAKILAQEVAKLDGDERKNLEPQMQPRETVVGTLPDGTVIGQVSRAKPAKSAKVTDEEALLAWVVKNRPDEVVVTRSVRSSFVDALKVQAKQDGWAYDVTTGEIIPGIEVVEGSSSYRPVPDDDARDLVLPQLLDLLTNGLMPSLPPAEGGS